MSAETSEPIINGAISANYVLTLSVVVIGFLITVIISLAGKYVLQALKSITSELKLIHERIDHVEDENAKVKESFTSQQHQDNVRLLMLEAEAKEKAQKTAELIVAKLRAMTP